MATMISIGAGSEGFAELQRVLNDPSTESVHIELRGGAIAVRKNIRNMWSRTLLVDRVVVD